MHWAPSTGNIWFDGPELGKTALEDKVTRLLGEGIPSAGTGEPGVVWIAASNKNAFDQLVNGLRKLNPVLPLETFGIANEDLHDRRQDRRRPAFGIVLGDTR
jgi:hypothetical protein